MKRTTALGACLALAAGSFALTPSAEAAPKQPGIVRAHSAIKPMGAKETSVSLTLVQSASQKATMRALARKKGSDRTAFASTQPAAAHRDAVLSWASSHGFRVMHASRFLVTVVGESIRLAAAFGTTVKQANGYTVRTSEPVVPGELTSHVESAVGLDNRPVRRHHAAFGPSQVRAMGQTPVRDSSAGTGVTVGTVNYSGWYPSDLTSYAADPEADGDSTKALSLAPGQVTEVPVGAANPAIVDASGGNVEVALDSEAILAVAPGAKQRLYFAQNEDPQSTVMMYDRMAADAAQGLLQVVSISWGTCEAYLGSTLGPETQAIDRLIAAGVTVFAASGDAGAYDCGYDEYGVLNTSRAVDFPASHPNVVGVGGTTTASGLTPGTFDHVAWGLPEEDKDPYNAADLGSSGGGFSQRFSRPSWQPPGAAAGRQVPDIAGLADPNTGLIGFVSADWPDDGLDQVYGDYTLLGGTSLAAPLSAAGLATVLGTTSPIAGLGNILPTLYGNPSVTHDVQGNGNGFYTAGPGYDNVAGLGVMNWTAFAALVSIPDPDVSLPAAVRTPDVPLTVTANASSYSSWGVIEGTGTSCAGNNLVSKPTSVTISGTQGQHWITVTALDTKGVCHHVTRAVSFDSVQPWFNEIKGTYTGTTTPKFTVTWAPSDAPPSSGFARTRLSLRDNTLGKTVYATDSRGTTAVLNAAAGHSYALTANVYDNAGNVSPSRVISLVAPRDDGSFGFSGFVRQNNGQDYMGSHAVASKAGSYAKFTFTGKIAWVGVIKSRSCGYLDVYVDGVRKARVNLYSSATKFRQQLRVATFSAVGTHTVVLKAVGTHQAGATGNNVYADSLTIAQ
ncbi:MAG TPA: protease pro-enzyme activation domain-containing protein [Nonomuraea sp.]|nr:protease pro-enzyme activation domain-containing protein [Nonomuraea sp.]